VQLRIPADLDAYGHMLRNLVKAKVARGHVELRFYWDRSSGGQLLSLNRPLLESWLTAFRQAKDQYLLDCQPDLNDAFRIPGMLAEADSEVDATVEALLTAVAGEAIDSFNKSREHEGAALGRVIAGANSRIIEHTGELAALRARVLPVLQQRLQERLQPLLGSAGLEPQRLVQEAAMLADRSDVTEEIHRLSIHARQLADLIDKGGEVGKRLDFLLQEMGRETNTILSKTSGAGELGLRVTDIGIHVKAEIERIREQALNLE
jgi:uncharacterized protein (TIGR00255 family)